MHCSNAIPVQLRAATHPCEAHSELAVGGADRGLDHDDLNTGKPRSRYYVTRPIQRETDMSMLRFASHVHRSPCKSLSHVVLRAAEVCCRKAAGAHDQ